MNWNDKIRLACNKLGLSHEDVARAMGITKASYYDIEEYPNEILEVYSMAESFALFDIVGLKIGQGMEREVHNMERPVNPIEISPNVNLIDLEDEVGYELKDGLANPIAAINTWNLDCLILLCNYLRLDYRSTLADYYMLWKNEERKKT